MSKNFRWFIYLIPIVTLIFLGVYSNWNIYDVEVFFDFGIKFIFPIFISTIINYFIFISHSRKYSKTSSFKLIFFLVGVISLSLFIFELLEFTLSFEYLGEEFIYHLFSTLTCLMIYIISIGIDRNRDQIIFLERDVYYLESKFNRDKIENQENSDTRNDSNQQSQN